MHGRDRVLVDKLRMTVARQQQAEIVDQVTNFHAASLRGQKDRQWRLVFERDKEGVL